MRTDRPVSRISTAPRLCIALGAAASGVVLCVAALAPVRAQTAQPNPPPAADLADLFRLPDAATVFSPLKDALRPPGRFRPGHPPRQRVGPLRFGEIQVYGNPPASGAGATGFDSSNA